MKRLTEELSGNTYPGRGIVIAKSADGKSAVIAYFIMGRSVNSRNRVFVPQDGGIRTEAHDPSQMSDPSLIIYAPVRVQGDVTIVTNGDQTDTIFDFLKEGKTFEEALCTREFEPDAPNFTPRISAVLQTANGAVETKMSILKSDGGCPDRCLRYTFDYPDFAAGEGRFIHTYVGDGSPIPSFEGEPTKVSVTGDIDGFTAAVWQSLNPDNKVSLFTRFIDLATGKEETRIVNKFN
ncbi:MAG: IMP cyclohydrolase [Clostridia bacterium]|nr:IMP cyclohydrolase [Clostridia bacterium]